MAFLGRSNVGKSSLLNRLLGSRKGLARVSSTPGRTQAVHYYSINGRCYFVDLPGYGYARAAKDDREGWARLVDAYFRQAMPRLKPIQIVDGRVGATPLDLQATEYLRGLGGRPTVVATKIDRVPKGRRQAALGRIREALELGPEETVIPFSARSGEGVSRVWREIEAWLGS